MKDRQTHPKAQAAVGSADRTPRTTVAPDPAKVERVAGTGEFVLRVLLPRRPPAVEVLTLEVPQERDALARSLREAMAAASSPVIVPLPRRRASLHVERAAAEKLAGQLAAAAASGHNYAITIPGTIGRVLPAGALGLG